MTTDKRDLNFEHEQHPLCDPVQKMIPSMAELKTKLNILIGISIGILTMFGYQNLRQIPQLEQRIDLRFAAQAVINAEVNSAIERHKQDDLETKRVFAAVFDSEQEVQSMLRSLRKSSKLNTNERLRPKNIFGR